jgi:hypothetical protein
MAPTTPAPPGSSRIAFRASPRGTRAGFAVLPDGAGGALTVTVLPKPWGPSHGRYLLIPLHVPGTTSHITLFETDSAEVQSTPTAIGALTQAILEIAGQQGRQDLLQLRALGRGIATPATDGGAFDSVVSLMLLAKRQKPALDDGYRGAAAESLLRLVEQQLFVDEVRRVVDRARPGYLERVDHLSSPRGALSGTSLALALLTGRPEVECRFDEQSTDTTVLRIVLAGLRAVATDRVPPVLARIAAPIRSQAVGLARRLDSVTVLDSERALLAARRLVLHSLEQQWAGALGGAVQVLSRRSVVPMDGDADTDRAVAIHLYMEKWWEECLLAALRSIADPGSVHEQVPVRAPWVPPGAEALPDPSRRADFIFGLDGRPMLADAKYKVDETSLGASDGDQMFAYSHTATVPGSSQLTCSGAVFYPQRGDVPRQSRAFTRDLLVRTTDPRYELRLLDLPFPSPTDVGTDAAWRGYLVSLADGIRQELAAMTVPAQPLGASTGS